MARAPNYDFERRERQKAKDAKKAAKAQAKKEGKDGEAVDGPSETQVPLSDEVDIAIARDKIQND